MKLKWDLIFGAGLLLSFFLPWVRPNFMLPQGSGFAVASNPDIPLWFLYLVPALAVLVVISSLLTNFHNRWFRIFAGLIPLGAVIWGLTAVNGLFSGKWSDTFQFLQSVLNWGIYIAILFAVLLLMHGIFGKARTA